MKFFFAKIFFKFLITGISNANENIKFININYIVNNYYSRWWWPKNEKSGKKSNKVLPWNGRYLDGFNNKITMHAYANPDSDSSGSGYGIIKFNKKKKEVTFECWPRYQDVRDNNAKQFKGWPVTVSLG